MSDNKKKQEKTAKVLTRTLADVLSGASSYREEATRLRQLGLETGPDLEDRLTALKERLARIDQDEAALDDGTTGLSSELFAAVVEVLATRRQVGALLRLKARHLGREEQKALGAALHKLEAQGVALPKARPGAGTPARPPEPPEAWLGIRNAQGNAVLSLFIPGAREDIMAHVELSELDGLGEVHFSDQGARGERRELVRSVENKQLPLFTVPVSHALFAIREAMDVARSGHRIIPLEVTEIVHMLEDRGYQPEQVRPAGIEDVQPMVSTLTRERPAIVLRPEVLSWHVDPSQLESIFGRFMEILSSQVVVSEQVRTERIAELMREGATHYFTPERRQRFARRLEDLALWFSHLGLRQETGWAWSAALALRDPSIPTSSISFAVSFIELRVMMILQELLPPDTLRRLQEEAGEAPPPSEPEGPRIILP